MNKVSIFWFRRDLRLTDNAGLYYALKSENSVIPFFIYDTDILDDLEDRKDARVDFIHHSIETLQKQLITEGASLHVFHDKPLNAFKKITETYSVASVYTNTDYEPYARKRDGEIAAFLKQKGISFYTCKDQVIFEKQEVVKDNNEPYTIFTPYSKKWKAALTDFRLKPYPTEKYFSNFLRTNPEALLSVESLGFRSSRAVFPPASLDHEIAKHYDKTRDYPAIDGTTRLSIHLRFGTISIRKFAKQAGELNETLLNELIWRDFYHMILWHFPKVMNEAFKKEYDNIRWRNNEKEFEHWCNGTTGYPIVDAGMRELNETGFMHNRVRMITASFLTKHLLIDWRWGEAYFAKKLLDYDLAPNNGGWQWAAGSGCDAVPYFRIFNPQLQTEKFDPDHRYIKKWVPEYLDPSYPKPIVDHQFARQRCLEVYKAGLSK